VIAVWLAHRAYARWFERPDTSIPDAVTLTLETIVNGSRRIRSPR
jgi:hypothetical protein